MAKIALSEITSAGIDPARLLAYVTAKGLSHSDLGTLLVGGDKDEHNVAYQIVSKSAPASLVKAIDANDPTFKVNLSKVTLEGLKGFYDTYVVGGADLPPAVATKAPATPASPASGSAPAPAVTPTTAPEAVAVDPSILTAVGQVWSAIRSDATPAPSSVSGLIGLLAEATPPAVLETETPRIITSALAASAGNRPAILETVIRDLNAEVQTALLASLRRNAPDAVANTVDDVTRRLFRLSFVKTAFDNWEANVQNAAFDAVEDINEVPGDEAMAVARKKVALVTLKALNTALVTEAARIKTAAEARIAEAARQNQDAVTPVAKIAWETVADVLPKDMAIVWDTFDANLQARTVETFRAKAAEAMAETAPEADAKK